MQVHADHVIERCLAPSLYLPKTCDSWLDFQHATTVPNLVSLELVLQRRTRTHKRHRTSKHIPKLRQFVQTCLAKERANTSNTRIFLQLEYLLLLDCYSPLELSSDKSADIFFMNFAVAVRPHGAKLQEPESFPMLAQAVLTEEHRALGCQLDCQGDQHKQRGKQDKRAGTSEDIHEALGAQG